jgi:hypothetical protein
MRYLEPMALPVPFGPAGRRVRSSCGFAGAVVLRLCLVLVLMANGMASATTAVHWHGVGHAVDPDAPATAAAAQAAPLPATTAARHGRAGDGHDGCETREPGDAQPAAHATASSTAVAGAHHGGGDGQAGECCGPGACQCACAYTGPPALPPDRLRGSDAPGQSCARALARGRPAPALPHLMRPPIG